MKKINENGRSMVEMLGVLAIIGVLSAGGLAGYSKAMFKHKLNSTMDQITMLATNIRTMYGTQGNYTGVATDAVKLGIVPSTMGTSVGSLTNPFKGKVTISTGSTHGANNSFTIKYESLPKEACIALASADFGAGAGSGFIQVIANNNRCDSDEGDACSVTNAANYCSQTGSANAVQWEFY